MYGVGGETELPEQELDHLSGYEDARPVRIGNAAATQRQHDVWGAVLDSVYLHGKRDLAASWRKAADEIHADICEHGTDERGVFVQHYETTALDASVLLMP